MSQEDEEQKILQQLQRFINTITLGQPWNYEANDEGVLERLEILAESLGKGANKGLLKRLRKILQSGKVEDKRKFVVSSIPPDVPNAETIKRAFKQATDIQVHTAFYFYAMTELGKPNLKERQKHRERLEHEAWDRELERIERGVKHFKELQKQDAVRSKVFQSSIKEFAEALEVNPDNVGMWGNLERFLRDIGKDYLSKAAESVYNKETNCHVRTKRELAKLLIEHGAPTAAEKVLDGATLDPFG